LAPCATASTVVTVTGPLPQLLFEIMPRICPSIVT